MKLIDALSSWKNFKRLDGEFGIEIETETLTPYDSPDFYFWGIHGDASLRNFGREYVLKQPVLFKDVKAALEEFNEKTKKLKFIKDSFSTSVHVHINMLNEEILTLCNFMTIYTLFENLLIRYSGPNRLSNLFCLPIIDAEEINHQCISIVQNASVRNFKSMCLSENSVKYAALNLSALGTYGSLEVRSFRGETEVDKIYLWVSILNKILEAARKKMTPKEFMDMYRKEGLKTKDIIFGDLSKEIEHPEEVELIESNEYFAGRLAYSIPDWSVFTQTDGPFKPTQKQIDTESIVCFGKSFSDLTGGEQEYIMLSLKRKWDKGMIRPATVKVRKKNPLGIALEEALDAPIPAGGWNPAQPPVIQLDN